MRGYNGRWIMRFGRKDNGAWVDVHEAASAAELGNRLGLSPALFVEVAAGCNHGDFTDGTPSGHTARPSPPVPKPRPRSATRLEVVDALEESVWIAWKSSSDASAALQFYRLSAMDAITPAQWIQFGNLLENKTLMTGTQNTAFKAAVPVA